MGLTRIGFAVNPQNDAAREALLRGQAWCRARGISTWDAAGDDLEQISRDCPGSDLICILGGDGTFLRTAAAIGDSGVPALGINLGRVGFLGQGGDRRSRAASWTRCASGAYVIEERFRISATLVRTDGTSETHACLNEVVVARGQRVRDDPGRGRRIGKPSRHLCGRWRGGRHPDRLDRLFVQRRRRRPRPTAAEHDHHPGGRLPLPAAQRGGR